MVGFMFWLSFIYGFVHSVIDSDYKNNKLDKLRGIKHNICVVSGLKPLTYYKQLNVKYVDSKLKSKMIHLWLMKK